jgi:hypothetical protein
LRLSSVTGTDYSVLEVAGLPQSISCGDRNIKYQEGESWFAQEQQFKDQFANLIAVFQTAFSNIPPPDTQWFYLWRSKYPVWAIEEAIHTLAAHPKKDRFTTESVGKAISTRLRTETLKRAIAVQRSTPVTRGAR